MKRDQDLSYYQGALDALMAVVKERGSLAAIQREIDIASSEVARIRGEFNQTVERFEAATGKVVAR